MSEVARIVTHYLETITKRAGLKGFDEIRAEMEAAIESDAQDLEKRLDNLHAEIDALWVGRKAQP